MYWLTTLAQLEGDGSPYDPLGFFGSSWFLIICVVIAAGVGAAVYFLREQ